MVDVVYPRDAVSGLELEVHELHVVAEFAELKPPMYQNPIPDETTPASCNDASRGANIPLLIKSVHDAATEIPVGP